MYQRTPAERCRPRHLALFHRALTIAFMSVEFAYRYRPDAPPSDLRDLDVVALTAAVFTDEGDEVAVGTEGTIVAVHGNGVSFVVEFDEPYGSLATVEPSQIRFVERSAA